MNKIYRIRAGRHGSKTMDGKLSEKGVEDSLQKKKILKKEISDKQIDLLEVLSSSSLRVLNTTEIYTGQKPKIKDRLNIRNIYPDSFFKEWKKYLDNDLDENKVAKAFLNGEFKSTTPEKISYKYIKMIGLLMTKLKKHNFKKNTMTILGTHATIPVLIPIVLCNKLNLTLPNSWTSGLNFNEQLDFDFQRNHDGLITLEINRRGIKKIFSYEDIKKVYKLLPKPL